MQGLFDVGSLVTFSWEKFVGSMSMDGLHFIDSLTHDRGRVLVHLFKAEEKEDRDVETMARKLAMERNVLRYHLDQLKEASLADMESGKYIYGRVYWAVTAEGRKHVVEGGLNLRLIQPSKD
jgi:hypothetical protein